MAASPIASPADPGLLITSLCRSLVSGEWPDDDVTALADDSYFAEFENRARQERVLGLILESAVTAPRFAEWPKALQSRFESHLRRMRHQGVFWDLQCEHVVTALRRVGCEPVLLKGGALRRTVYRSPAQRPVADLDVLVPRVEVDECVSALARLGYHVQPSDEMRAAYEAHHFHIVLRNVQGFIVEVHWDLTTPYSTYRLDPSDFISSAVKIGGTGNQAVSVPRPEHTFLHLVSQLAIEYPFLGRLIDLDLLVRSSETFDWRFTVDAAHRYGLKNALALWMAVLHDVFDTPIPHDARAQAERVTLLVRMHLALLEVPSFMLAPRRRGMEAMFALRLWQRPDGSRLRHFARLVGRHGQLDEEAWAFMHGGRTRVLSTHFILRHYRGMKDVVKLVGYHVWLYARGLISLASPERRTRFALWSRGVPNTGVVS